jgi:hypothetical protein
VNTFFGESLLRKNQLKFSCFYLKKKMIQNSGKIGRININIFVERMRDKYCKENIFFDTSSFSVSPLFMQQMHS